MSEDLRNARVSFLSQYFWPEETATAELLSGVAFELTTRGMQVSAVAGQPTYHGAGRLPRYLEKDNLKIRRVPSTQCDKNRTIGRILNTLTFAASASVAATLSRDRRILIAVTNPPLLPWVARLTKGLRGTPYILVIHDVYPQIAVALGRVRAGSIIDRSWRFLNRCSYRGASRIVVLGECMAEVVRSELPPEERSKVVVITNWADGDSIKPMPREGHPLLKELGLEKKFVVQYSGNIGLFHEIETIVDAAEKIQDQSIHFLFIGDGGKTPWLKRAVKDRQIKNLTLLPFQSKERLPLSLTACDVGLATLKEGSTGFCVPSKLYGILAAGKPVIAVMHERCETAQSVMRHKCGAVVSPGDSERLIAEINRMKSDPEGLRSLDQAARKAYEENHTLQLIAGQYTDLVVQVLREANELTP